MKPLSSYLLLVALGATMSPVAFAKTPAHPLQTPQPAQKTVKSVVKKMIVKRAGLDRLLSPDHLEKSLEMTVVRPYFVEKKIKGLEYLSIPTDSFLHELGLMDKDIWIKIDDQDIDVLSLLEAFKIIKHQSHFSIELLREGRLVTHQIIVQ